VIHERVKRERIKEEVEEKETKKKTPITETGQSLPREKKRKKGKKE